MAKVIVTAAITGGGATPTMTPYLPITPQQIADEAVRSYEAGAAIAHVHVRNPETGQPSSNVAYFREVAESVKSRCNVILCFTTGGTPDMTVEERAKVVRELKPELASFNAGSLNFPIHTALDSMSEFKFDWEKPHLANSENSIFPNTYKTLREFGQMFKETNTKPELEIYDSGMVYNLLFQIEKGYIEKPVHIQFVMGVMGGLPATTTNLSFLYDSCKAAIGDFTWSTCAISRFQFPMTTVALTMGGHVRVGMEDNLYIEKGVLAKSNAELVEKIIRISRELGREPMTPDEARQYLNLKGVDKVNF
jgi:uncharacterized protein (DUF849 family)